MADLPLVSIVMPVYNGANYMRSAVDSALAQTYPRTEVVLVNDGSRDDGETDRIARSYGDRIRYFQKDNGGVATALNLGIEKMRGAYFSWLSHDDIYLPHKLERQVRYHRRLPPDAISYSDFDVIDQESRHRRTVRIQPKTPERFRIELMLQQFLHGCSLLIPRRHFDSFGGFNPDLRTTQDFDLWFRMAKHVPFVHLAEVLIQHRSHAQQGSHTIPATSELNLLYIRVLNDLGEAELQLEGSASATHYHLAVAMAVNGFHAAAAFALLKFADHAREEGWSPRRILLAQTRFRLLHNPGGAYLQRILRDVVERGPQLAYSWAQRALRRS